MKIAYLGPAGTFTENAAREYFKNEEPTLIPLSPIRKVILSVENSEVDFGVVPIENFYNGEVKETLDSLYDIEKAEIIGEVSLEIVHCFGVLPDVDLKNIKKILSKDQALEQCSSYLCENYSDAQTIATSSTKEAAEIIKKNNFLDAAAIGPEKALTESGLKVIDKDICPNNRTRFAIIGLKEKIEKPSEKDKTFLVLHSLQDKPGLLYKVLGFFYEGNVNLNYIQSRPDGKNGYRFYMELEGHESDGNVRGILDKINKEFGSGSLKVLGSFKDSNWKDQGKGSK